MCSVFWDSILHLCELSFMKNFHIRALILSLQADRWDRYQYFHIKDARIKTNTAFHAPVLPEG